MYAGISANERKEGARNMEINEQNFGENYHLITITNQNGTSLSVSDLGARVVHFQTIIDNEKRELILGFDEAKEYLEKTLISVLQSDVWLDGLRMAHSN